MNGFLDYNQEKRRVTGLRAGEYGGQYDCGAVLILIWGIPTVMMGGIALTILSFLFIMARVKPGRKI